MLLPTLKNERMEAVSNQRFIKAYNMASNTELRFPPDIMLHFYAYYKRATHKDGFYTPENNEDVYNGFKANALLQVENLSPAEAKNKYVEMVEKHIGKV